MFSWKYHLRLLNFFNDPYCSVIYSKRMAWLQEQGPELHRVPACWASFLCQAQVNISPVDVDSCSPLFNYTVYEHWVHTVPEDCGLQTCLQMHKVLLLLSYHWSRAFWCLENISFLIIHSLSASMPVWSEKHNLDAEWVSLLQTLHRPRTHRFRQLNYCFWSSTQKEMLASHPITVVVFSLTASNTCS